MARRNTAKQETTGNALTARTYNEVVNDYKVDVSLTLPVDAKINGKDFSKLSAKNQLDACKVSMQLIVNAQESLVTQIARVLYIVDKRKLYELDDFKSTAKWAEHNYGISKQSVSDALAVYNRFGTEKGLPEKYADYQYSKLLKMKSLDDKEIEFLELRPNMTRKTIEDSVKRLSNLKKIAENLELSNIIVADCITEAESLLSDYFEEHPEKTLDKDYKLVDRAIEDKSKKADSNSTDRVEEKTADMTEEKTTTTEEKKTTDEDEENADEDVMEVMVDTSKENWIEELKTAYDAYKAGGYKARFIVEV